MAAKKHKDVEFMVSGPEGYRDMYSDDPNAAVALAASRSVSRGGEPVTLDVLVSSKAGARWFGGDHGVEVYEEDPEASVHERFIVKAESQGRIA